jgi:rubrerythrin
METAVMGQLPSDAPASAGEAFARLNSTASPTIDDLKVMVYIEASGQSAYFDLARGAPNDEIRGLMEANGREEMAHAHRVARVIKLISGEDFAVPKAEDNCYVAPSPARTVDRRLLESLVGAEDNGCTLYETWASHIGHAEAEPLLRLNAREESRHGERMAQAIALLEA